MLPRAQAPGSGGKLQHTGAQDTRTAACRQILATTVSLSPVGVCGSPVSLGLLLKLQNLGSHPRADLGSWGWTQAGNVERCRRWCLCRRWGKLAWTSHLTGTDIAVVLHSEEAYEVKVHDASGPGSGAEC